MHKVHFNMQHAAVHAALYYAIQDGGLMAVAVAMAVGDGTDGRCRDGGDDADGSHGP